MPDITENQLGIVIYTYDRVDDAKINMEIIKHVWSIEKQLKDAVIIHVFNGDPQQWPEKYLENELIYLENLGHFAGCAYQIDVGIRYIQDNYPNVNYTVVLASDTWILKPKYLVNILDSMKQRKYFFASCGWGLPVQQTNAWKDAAVDFFVVDMLFNNSFDFFPLNYASYLEKYGEVFGLLNTIVYVESLIMLRFKQALLRYLGNPPPSENLIDGIIKEYIYLMMEREPVHRYQPFFERIMHYPALGMLGHHDPEPKQLALKKYTKEEFGPCTLQFLNATDLSYFNKGLINWTFTKDSMPPRSSPSN